MLLKHMLLKFDVFGKPMSVIRTNDEWLLFRESQTGMRVRVYDVVIPAQLAAHELGRYLDDIYHEHSSATHSRVKQIN